MKKIFIVVCVVTSLFCAEQQMMEGTDGEYLCNMEYDKCMDVCAAQDNDNTCVANCEDKFNTCIEQILEKKTPTEQKK